VAIGVGAGFDVAHIRYKCSKNEITVCLHTRRSECRTGRANMLYVKPLSHFSRIAVTYLLS
jgi:hypothetical protein